MFLSVVAYSDERTQDRAVALNPLMASKPGAIGVGFPLAEAYRPGNTEPV